MNSVEISEYKAKIMKHLLADDELVQLVDPAEEMEYRDDLIYSRFYPFNRIPDTEQEVKTYITVMVDIPTIYAKNDVARNVNIRIRVYSHEMLMQVKGKNGNRIDLISARIDQLLNESYDFGIGYVELGSNTEHVLDSKHFYREMIFKTVALNNHREGVRQWNP